MTDRLGQVTFASGVGSLGVFVMASIVLAIYPPAAGHQSAFFSDAGAVLFLMSALSAVLGPVAIVTGVKALRRFGPDTTRRRRVATWVGITAGGAYTLMMILPFVVLFLFA